jgi:2-(1,2-epoxy-1,2-dihydrophenyl)acetyl-CoA isomerase
MLGPRAIVRLPTVTTVELETVKLELDSGVARIVLNRPEALNAWTRQLGEDMRSALAQSADDPEVRAIVFTGAGRAFSSGADLKSGAELGGDGKIDVRGRLDDVYHPLILGIRTVPKPVIAQVNGPAVGIGCSLALAADLIVAAESSYFLLAFVNIGLGLDGGASQSLPARVGHARAFEMAYLGERIPAPRALEWGMVNQVVPGEQLEPVVAELAARFVAGPAGSYANIKRTINHRLYAGFDELLELEAELQQGRVESADFMEAVMAFAQRRQAKLAQA